MLVREAGRGGAGIAGRAPGPPPGHRAAGRARTPVAPFLLKVCCPYATIMPDGDYRDEIKIPCVVPDAFPYISSRPVRTRNRQALRCRILLQGQVGTCRRISAALQEEPLPAVEEAS